MSNEKHSDSLMAAAIKAHADLEIKIMKGNNSADFTGFGYSTTNAISPDKIKRLRNISNLLASGDLANLLDAGSTNLANSSVAADEQPNSGIAKRMGSSKMAPKIGFSWIG